MVSFNSMVSRKSSAWSDLLVALSIAASSGCTRADSSGDVSKNLAVALLDAGVRMPAIAPPGTTQVTIPHAEVAPELDHECKQICERSRQLKCKNLDLCIGNCIAMATVTPCAEPVQGLYRCLAGEPLAHWECADDGVAAIREGFCDKEQGQTVACIEAKMQR